MTDYTDLIERLRTFNELLSGDQRHAAADAIEALQRENARLRLQVLEDRRKIEQLREDLADVAWFGADKDPARRTQPAWGVSTLKRMQDEAAMWLRLPAMDLTVAETKPNPWETRTTAQYYPDSIGGELPHQPDGKLGFT